MRAEIEYTGVKEELTLPENTVFVNFKAHRTDGKGESDCAIIGADVKTVEEMLGCIAVKIGTKEYPIDFEIHAYTDPDGALVQRLAPYAGMKIIDLCALDYRFTVTV